MESSSFARCAALLVIPLLLHCNGKGTGSNPTPGEERQFKIADGTEMTFCWVPPGEFLMGSPESEEGRRKNEGPQRRVRITEGFWMGKYEVTQEEWAKVTGREGSELDGYIEPRWSGARFPRAWVGWFMICGNDERTGGFLGQVNEHAPESWRFDLPTEAQWEYACRGGPKSSEGPFFWGTSLNGKQANMMGDHPYGTDEKGPRGSFQDVGSHEAVVKHPLGLCDMHGSVSEWCRDLYQYQFPATDEIVVNPAGPEKGRHRVVRGGHWRALGDECRGAIRVNHPPETDWISNFTGFRLILRSTR